MSSLSRSLTDSDNEGSEAGRSSRSNRSSLSNHASATQAHQEMLLRSSLGIPKHSHARLKKQSHSSTFRGARGSSTTTHMELLGEIKSNNSRPRVFSDNRTEFGSFKSSDHSIVTRSMRVESGASKNSGQRRTDLSRTGRGLRKKPKGKVLPDFMLGKMIGEGSYSRVHVCKLKTSGDLFAIKIMDKKHIVKSKMIDLIKLEMKVLASVNCSHIVRLFWSFSDKSFLYLVLELCTGGDLSKVIKHFKSEQVKAGIRKRAVPMERTKFYVAETLQGIQFLHHNGYVHRDIKPQNILLASSGHVKIADFGTVKDENQEDVGDSQFVGSALYVSPEQLLGERVSVGADLWALGVLVYDLLVGESPFAAETEFLIMEKVEEHSKNSFVELPLMQTEDEKSIALTADELIAEDLINKLLKVVPTERLGAANNFTPARKEDFDKSENQPRLLRNHGFFDEIDFATLTLSEPPSLVYNLDFPDPAFDGADNQWMRQGEATDLGLPESFLRGRMANRETSRGKKKLSSTIRSVEINLNSFNSTDGELLPPANKSKDKRMTKSRSNNALSLFKGSKQRRKLKKTASKRFSNIGKKTRRTLNRLKGSVKKTLKVDEQSNLDRASQSEATWVHYNLEDISVGLDRGEEILAHGAVKKRNGVFTKPRILILTSKRRFLFFHPQTFARKGEIPVTNDTECVLQEGKGFEISGGRSYSFIDVNGDVERWRKVLLQLQSS